MLKQQMNHPTLHPIFPDAFLRAGFTPDLAKECALKGNSLRYLCNEFSPPQAGGFFAWAGTITALGERLVESGWTREELNGLSVVISPDRTRAIAVATGDAATGTGRTARSRHPRGPATIVAVSNNQQLALFELKDYVASKVADPNLETWFLLVHRAPDALWIELSLPVGLDDTARLSAWREQIPLGAVALEQTIDTRTLDTGVSIDVPVIKRVASE